MLTLASDFRDMIPVVAIAGGIAVAIVSIVAGTIQRMVRSRAYEESRREIAAYVAEGSVTPEDAERLLKAGSSPGGRRCRDA